MRVKSRFIFMVIIVLIFGGRRTIAMHAQPIDEKPVALMNGVAHLGNGEIIENAVITFAQGNITLVADARLVRLDLTGYQVIDIFGKHVYPIQRRSKNKKQKSFKIIDAQGKQLTEHQPANLLVTTHELKHADNSVVKVFLDGKAQSEVHFVMKKKCLKIK